MYNVLDIARFVINYCNDKGYSISNLRLQKLLYFIQAYYLGVKNKAALFGEDFEAWDFGPVIPCVYHEYKSFGGNDIPKISSYFKGIIPVKYDANLISRADRNNITHVIELFRNISTSKMVSITHGQEPWIKAYNNALNKTIDKKDIKKYFVA